MLNRRTLALCFALTVMACASVSIRTSADAKILLDGLWSQYVEALRAGDATRLAGFFTEDAVLMEPDRDVRGREGIREFAGPIFQTMKVQDAVVTAGDTIVCDSAIHQFGKYTETISQSGRPDVTVRGRYFVIWRQQTDGSWKISHLMVSPEPPLRSAS